jgi:hypothetical protein
MPNGVGLTRDDLDKKLEFLSKKRIIQRGDCT